MRIAGRILVLVALWLLAWGDATLANVISGVAVASALLVAFPPARRVEVRINPVGAVRLIGYVVTQLLISNLVMARQILRIHPTMHPGVLAHRLQTPSEEVITVMSSVIALSPGTMTVDVDEDSTTIYVHFLLLHDVAAARASLARLECLTVRAISEPDAPVPTIPSSAKESP
jgi:multicomponent Na+:H+ antiporter subunit E